MTQSEVAENLNVSFQAVSLWERGENYPDMDKLVELAALYRVTTDWLLTGKKEENVFIDFRDSLFDRLFDENRMYTYVKTYATAKNLYQTAKVLPYARELHEGQFRKGKDKVPYIYHPLLIACHALALGLDEISKNPIATMVKLLDRCNNISGMAAGFSKEKMVEYIKETEKLVYPLLQKVKREYPKYSNQIFLIKYHTTSVMEAIKHQS